MQTQPAQAAGLLEAIPAGRGEKMELVYAYLTGAQFQRHVESLAATFAHMGDDLLKEKRVITTSWHRREKQLERVAASVTGLCGDLHGIAGTGALPRIEALEFAGLLEAGSDSVAMPR